MSTHTLHGDYAKGRWSKMEGDGQLVGGEMRGILRLEGKKKERKEERGESSSTTSAYSPELWPLLFRGG